MTDFDYDLFVIGGGSGGVRAARIAASHGARVAVAEEYRYGGTCVIRGCVPKKLLVYASRFHDEFEDAAGFGWTVPTPSFDWPKLVAAKEREITRLEGIYRANLERVGVTTFASRAVLEAPGRVRLVADDRSVTARHILIATGAAPNLGDAFPGREHAITSNEAFDLPTFPRRVVVVGGGYIAVEFAGVFAGLGAQTTIVYRGPRILRGFDDDMRDGLTTEYERRGISIRANARIAAIDKAADGLHVRLDDGSVIVADQVLLAVGRDPNSAGLGLEKAGVATAAKGRIVVDARSATSVPGIWAVGDVTDRLNLTPVAIREGHAFADSVFGGKPWAADHDMVATAVFSTPEIGTVGLSEAAARERFATIDIYKTRFRPMKGTLSGREERTIMKLVVDAATDRVLGCHVLGPDAAEMVQMAAIAMRMGARKADFDATMPLHPCAAEELVTLRDKWQPP